MKEIYLKELREGVKLALIGLIIFGVLLAQSYKSSQEAVLRMATNTYGDGDSFQPLLSESLSTQVTVFCAIFGAVLGWMQIFTERHRDLWAFLIHRPISRDRIFAAKLLAGISLYVVGAGLPLAWLVGTVAKPGHVAAPFEWQMALPVVELFLCGLVFYFAGMLTGLRQARWYASRGLGLGAAIVVMVMVAVTVRLEAPGEIWRSTAAVITGLAVVGIAAWGSFRTGGYYAHQPRMGRLALILTLGAGCVVVMAASLFILTSITEPLSPSTYYFQNYEMTRDGKIYRAISKEDQKWEYFNLDGTPLLSKVTGKRMEAKEFNAQRARGSLVPTDNGRWMHDAFVRSIRYFTLWRVTDKKLWYLSRHGQLLGYDATTRHFLGSLQPDAASTDDAGARGAAQDISARDSRFIYPIRSSSYYNTYNSARTLASKQSVYEVDPDERKLRLIYTATNGDQILGTTDTPTNTLVATKGFIQLVGDDGQLAWRVPFEPGRPDYGDASVDWLDGAPGRYALWISPLRSDKKLPTYVLYINEGRIVPLPGQGERIQLPPFEFPVYPVGLEEKVFSYLLPPWDLLDRHDHDTNRRPDEPNAVVRMIPEFLCAIVGWGLGRRFRFSIGARCGWGLFLLATGIPGLLTFFCVQEWPAREVCAECHRRRTVDRESCEYCGAGFPPPERNGTEIFEPLEDGDGGGIKTVEAVS